MCLLTFFPEGAQPDCNALLNGAVVNDDGHGFAIVVRDRIIIRRNMNADRLVEDFALMRRFHPDGPALFHSRYGTHGSNDKSNVHPFHVGGDDRTVVAHNGIMPTLLQPAKGDPRSDTRITAEEFLPMNPFGSLTSKRARSKLGSWITGGNKLVILTVDPRFRGNAFIINEQAGIWDGDVWYSNGGYRPYVPPRGWSLPKGGGLGLDENCWWCDQPIEGDGMYCFSCNTCLDCGSSLDDCNCYLPMALTQGSE